jgi:hypothetical protein
VARHAHENRYTRNTHAAFRRCVSINVYREKSVVAGAGFEALSEDVEIFSFSGLFQLASLYLKNPRLRLPARVTCLDVIFG